jgi:hypothetical protein
MDGDPRSAVWKFPAACPRCSAVKGLPFMAATMRNGGTCVSLRCSSCRYEWELEIAANTLGFGRKSDRRQGDGDVW